MELIIETDLGHDPDDFFAICYLIAAGATVKCVNLTPGFGYQTALADLIRRETGAKFDIGVAQWDKGEGRAQGFYGDLLHRYGNPPVDPDGSASTLSLIHLESSQFLVIGPPKGMGQFFADHPYVSPLRVVIQGGFCGYRIHRPRVTIPEFEGQEFYPSFNPNGCPSGIASIQRAVLYRRDWVSKNVCHTVILDRSQIFHPRCRASELFCEGVGLYLSNHDRKKFHDPTAAVCLLHPEIAQWTRADMVRRDGKWGAVENPTGDHVIVDIDHEALWGHLRRFE